MSTYAKYMDRYKRIRSASSDGKSEWEKHGQMYDKDTYTKFIELQLEKVSGA